MSDKHQAINWSEVLYPLIRDLFGLREKATNMENVALGSPAVYALAFAGRGDLASEVSGVLNEIKRTKKVRRVFFSCAKEKFDFDPLLQTQPDWDVIPWLNVDPESLGKRGGAADDWGAI
jgi:hypothetical protein